MTGLTSEVLIEMVCFAYRSKVFVDIIKNYEEEFEMNRALAKERPKLMRRA